MPKVTALEPQRRRGRYNLYLDGTFALGLSERVVAEAGLWVGRELSPEEVEALEALERRARALEDGLRLLAHRPRSRAELEARLRRKGHPAEAIDHALRRLTELGYVEDGAFARAWVRERWRRRGPRALVAELRQKGVERDRIERALAEAPSDLLTWALEVGRRRARQLADADPEVFRRRLGAYLLRRGFPSTVVRQAVERLWEMLDADGGPLADPLD